MYPCFAHTCVLYLLLLCVYVCALCHFPLLILVCFVSFSFAYSCVLCVILLCVYVCALCTCTCALLILACLIYFHFAYISVLRVLFVIVFDVQPYIDSWKLKVLSKHEFKFACTCEVCVLALLVLV